MYLLLQRRRRASPLVLPTSYALYVNAASGSDISSGSLSAPLKTMAQAGAMAALADPAVRFTIYYTGTFGGVVLSRGNIEYLPYLSGLIDADGDIGFDLGGFDLVGISNAEITNTSYAVHAGGGSGHSLANLYIHEVEAGIRLIDCDNPAVLGGTIYHTTSGEGIWLQDGSGGLIAGVDGSRCAKRVAYASGQPGVVMHDIFAHDADSYNLTSNYAVELEDGCDDAVLYRIWAKRCNNGVIIKTSDNVLASSIVAWDCWNYGGYMKGATNSTFEYGDFYHNGNGTTGGANVGVLQDDSSEDENGDPILIGSVGNTVAHNIMSNAVTYGTRTDPLSTGNTWHDNDYYGNAVAVGRTPSNVYASLAAWQAAYGDANSTEIDPAYNNTNYGGFVAAGVSGVGHTASSFNL